MTEDNANKGGNYDPETETWLSDAELEAAEPEVQTRVMKHWFHQNYTDPVENTPYESAEGGYIFIWGGPFDAREELQDNFGGLVPDEVIEELAERLDDIAPEWTGNPDEFAVDDYVFDAIGSSEVYRASLQGAISTIEQSLDVKMDEPLHQNFLRMLYVGVIAAMEAYLSDFFISALKDDETLLRKFVESTKEFRDKKIPVSDVFKAYEGIEATAKEFLLALTWHNLPRVKPLYKDVLQIEFKEETVSELIGAIAVRHDIVHRNGKKKDGVEVAMTRDEITRVLGFVKELVKGIEDRWFEIRHPLPLPF
jgi:RiboL-PSP-HEPN